jgi:hypothetical protein
VSDKTFTELGLIARKRGPGRPKKASASDKTTETTAASE